MSERYPNRGKKFHANDVTRAIFERRVCSDLGHHAVTLIIYVAHTEDRTRYERPVTFWNGQLEDALAFSSPKQLNKARRLAVEAGWLHYSRAHNRKITSYYTTIPEPATEEQSGPNLSASGNVSQDGNISPRGKRNGRNLSPNLSPRGTTNGKPSYPTPKSPPPPCDEWEEVVVEANKFGIEDARSACMAAHRRGVTVDEAKRLLGRAKLVGDRYGPGKWHKWMTGKEEPPAAERTAPPKRMADPTIQHATKIREAVMKARKRNPGKKIYPDSPEVKAILAEELANRSGAVAVAS